MIEPKHRVISLTDGKRIAITEYGSPDGRPVLAFHGAPATGHMFSLAHDAAARLGLRLIAPDRPGCGASPPEAVARTLASHASDMVALAGQLGIGAMGLIGVSGGGPYAAATAAQLGDRALFMALVSPVGPLAGDAATLSMTHFQRFFFLRLPRNSRTLRSGAGVASAIFHAFPSLVLRVLAAMLGDADWRVLTKREAAALLIPMTQDALRQGTSGAVRDLELYGSPWGFDPRHISAPAIVWQGDEDRVVPAAGAHRLAGLIPGCRLVRFPGGHFWVLEHIDDVVAALDEGMPR